MGDTIQRPGTDAGIVRVHGTNKAVSSSVDSSAVYCDAHPMTGGKQIVCESWRNLISCGSKPIAITNCLNFGNPEKEKNMGEFVECVEGINEASKFLDYPVVSGNVSFYNETKDKGVKPTPTIGGVGLINNYKNVLTMNLKKEGNLIIVVGKTEGHIEQSVFARDILNEKKGPPPEINLFNEKNNGETILELISEGLLKSCHDVALGGIIVAISKMAIIGKKGFNLNIPKVLINKYDYYFGEDQGRYIIEIETKNLSKVEKIMKDNLVHFEKIGKVAEKNIEIDKEPILHIDELIKSNKDWLKSYMEK